MPRVVSMGPRFKGSREDLLLLEEVKLRSMMSLLYRAGKQRESKTYLEKCSKAVWTLDEQVRASYVFDIKLKKVELANIMLVDGCFLLELMIAKKFDSHLPSRLIPAGPASEVLKDEDVLSDLMLLENQIPILVLHKLSQILFPNVFDPTDREVRATKLNYLLLSVLGYSLSQVTNPILTAAPHILESVHFFVNNTRKGSDVVGNYVVSINDTTQHLKMKLKRSASWLQAAGVTFKLAEETRNGTSCFSFLQNCFMGNLCNKLVTYLTVDNRVDSQEEEVKGLNFYFNFKKGKLEIAQLHITKTTKAKWLNFIALEHQKNNWKRYNFSKVDYESHDEDQMSKSSLNWKFTSSALIYGGLICSADDAKLLKEKNIIVDHLKMSNEELKEFFLHMTFGIDRVGIDSNYVQMVDNLNNYSQAFLFVRILKIFWILFKYQLEWFFNFFETYYKFVAGLLAVLTTVQTVYTVLNYHFPK